MNAVVHLTEQGRRANELALEDATAKIEAMQPWAMQEANGVGRDDPFLAQAEAYFKGEAARSRELHQLKELLIASHRDLDRANATIESQKLTIEQLHQHLRDARAREADANQQAGFIKGIMNATAVSLSSGARTSPARAAREE